MADLQVVVTPKARQDLQGIWNFRFVNSSSFDSADTLIRKIATQFELLQHSPKVGMPVPWLQKGIRKLIYKDFVILYKIDETVVVIVRIFPGAKLWEDLF